MEPDQPAVFVKNGIKFRKRYAYSVLMNIW